MSHFNTHQDHIEHITYWSERNTWPHGKTRRHCRHSYLSHTASNQECEPTPVLPSSPASEYRIRFCHFGIILSFREIDLGNRYVRSELKFAIWNHITLKESPRLPHVRVHCILLPFAHEWLRSPSFCGVCRILEDSLSTRHLQINLIHVCKQ